MATYVSNRDSGGKTDEKGHFKFISQVFSGNVLSGQQVVQNSTPGMSVFIGEGDLRFPVTAYYAEMAWSEGNTIASVSTADPSNPRIDRLIAYLDRSMTFVSTDINNPGMLKYKTVAGTPNASPSKVSDAAVQTSVGALNPWIELATIRVAAAATQILNAVITDTRQFINLSTGVAANHITPVGSVNDFAGTTAPTGWLLCYGQAVSRSTYQTLFSVISTTYGVGDGSTTFNLPDCRGRLTAGKDNMGGTAASRLTGQPGGVTGSTLGGTGGGETVVLTTGNLAPQTGQIVMHSQATATNIAAVGGVFSSGYTNGAYVSGGTGGSGPQSIGIINFSNSGTSTPVNEVPPTIIFNKIIKY